MSSKPRDTTTTQKVEVPEFQRPFLERILTESEKLFESDTPQFFPGQTVVNQSPETLQALSQQANFARSNPLIGDVGGLLSSTIQGDFLNQNPFAQQAFDSSAQAVTRNFRDAVQPSIDSSFARAGRFGSDAFQNQTDIAQENLGRNLNNLAQGFFFDNFARERQNQQQAINQAPIFQNLAAANFGLLGNVGARREAFDQSLLQDQINRFNFEQNLPAQKLQQFAGLVGGTDLGKTVSNIQQVHTNPSLQAAGLASTIGGLMTGNPFMAMGGAFGGSPVGGLGAGGGLLAGGF